MATDGALAARIRTMLDGEPALSERRMFGGIAFLVAGNMAVADSGQGGLMVRVDPEEAEQLVARTPATFMEMRGRELAGWLFVAREHLDDDAELAAWVRRGVAFARTLPAK